MPGSDATDRSVPTSSLPTPQIGLRGLPDAVQGLVLFSVESALTGIAMRRHRGGRVSDQEETLVVIRAVFNALGLVEVQGAETCLVHLDGVMLETGNGDCDMADDVNDAGECEGRPLYRLSWDPSGDAGASSASTTEAGQS